MARFGRQHGSGHAHAGERPLVFVVEAAVEDQFLVGRAGEPAIVDDLVFELAGRPEE